MKDSGNSFHARHLKRALDYVMNPEKTQRGRLVGAVNCQADMAFEQMKETVAKFKKLLTDNGAEIVNEEAWGLKKMAYAIQKKSTGFYCLLEFKAEPTIIKTLETGYRRDEKVIRYITVKLDKYAAQYAEKRVNKFKKEEA